MKISDDYLLRKVCDSYAFVPVGMAIEEGLPIMRMNETGYNISIRLLNDTDIDSLIDTLVKDYEVDETELEGFYEYIRLFVDTLIKKKIVTNL